MTSLPKVLCVDDEPALLEALELTLGRAFRVTTVGSGREGLAMLETGGPFEVVLSDMRMPEMDGATFLSRVRRDHPESVRLLLTGEADLPSAVKAVNEGQVFRFLTKPCPAQQLKSVIDEAVTHQRLQEAERVLLEQTLRGSVEALCEVLALTDPLAFSRAARIKELVGLLAESFEVKNRWPLEVAAMVLHLGVVTLPRATVQRAFDGEELSAEDAQKFAALPLVAERLLSKIPRLEPVRDLLRVYPQRRATRDSDLSVELLRVAADYEALERRGHEPEVALAVLRGHPGAPEEVLAELGVLLGMRATVKVSEVRLDEVRPGMVFVDDVRFTNGTLLVPKGFEVSRSFVERCLHFAPGSVREPLRVRLRV